MTDKHGAVFALAGWSGSGKTTLVEQLVAHLVGLGYDIATVKHAHHHFDADTPGKDSFRHRQAGSRQVLVSSAQRSALFTEHADNDEPDLLDLLGQLAPADLVIVEGFKKYPIGKIEIFRPSVGKPHLYPQDDLVMAVASDEQLDDCPLPVFDLSDVAAIANFIIVQNKLKRVC
ncbi:molybdopterin-guanine dinucleotide biosynthesis protein B [Alphaproteobacteria bacterium]|nr:molybdopterin-guanine dinucleotide biosynthesis protein B [Alphaproteobacteria bacterium]